MVHKKFGIYSDDLNGCELYIETGAGYIACWSKHPGNGLVLAFEYFDTVNTEAGDFSIVLNDVKHNSALLQTYFEAVHCIWNNDKACCIPAAHCNDALLPAYFELMFGAKETGPFMKNELHHMVIVAPLPSVAAEIYAEQLKVRSNMHKYYNLLNAQQPAANENSIYMHFNPTSCIISVYKDANLQLIQSYNYAVAEDVLYHVLHICETLGLDIGELKARAGGLIDTTSPLYEKLNAYISNFEFEHADKEKYPAEGFHEYPLHYFASFCN